MVFSLFEYLDEAIAITDSMFNFGKFFTKKTAITFDLTKIERKKIIFHYHEILLRIQWCHQKLKNRKKKNQLFYNIFFNKIVIFQKNYRFF